MQGALHISGNCRRCEGAGLLAVETGESRDGPVPCACQACVGVGVGVGVVVLPSTALTPACLSASQAVTERKNSSNFDILTRASCHDEYLDIRLESHVSIPRYPEDDCL